MLQFGVTRQKLSQRPRQVCATLPLEHDVSHAGPRELVTHREPGLAGTDHHHVDPIAHRGSLFLSASTATTRSTQSASGRSSARAVNFGPDFEQLSPTVA